MPEIHLKQNGPRFHGDRLLQRSMECSTLCLPRARSEPAGKHKYSVHRFSDARNLFLQKMPHKKAVSACTETADSNAFHGVCLPKVREETRRKTCIYHTPNSPCAQIIQRTSKTFPGVFRKEGLSVSENSHILSQDLPAHHSTGKGSSGSERSSTELLPPACKCLTRFPHSGQPRSARIERCRSFPTAIGPTVPPAFLNGSYAHFFRLHLEPAVP